MSLDNVQFLKDYISVAPIPLALVRAIDCRHLSKIDWKGKILDLGCGDGLFSRILFQNKVRCIDTGIDFNIRELKKAQKSGMYRTLIPCNCTAMPLEAGSFDIVFSNSVLEHIPDIDSALVEVNRVLRPGGQFVFTVPSEYLSKQLFFPMVFKKIKLNFLAKKYIDFKNKSWKHYHLYPPEAWADKLKARGLEVVKHQYIHPQAITRLCDLFTFTGVISVICRKLFNRLLLFPNPLREKFLVKMLKKYYYLDSETGSTIFIVAKKVI